MAAIDLPALAGHLSLAAPRNCQTSMCRLFGFHASEPTRIECGLVRSQNSLLAQGIRDRAGLTHGHGWGIAEYRDAPLPLLEKQAWAAWEGEQFKKRSANVYARTVIAHVRRATVGAPTLVNTHPFVHGHWAFAHNGTVKGFERVRPLLLESIDPLHRNEIHGETDSEHVFRLLLSVWSRHPARCLMETMRLVVRQVVHWSTQAAPGELTSLNLLWTDGKHMVGTRLNRTLWYLEREGDPACEICGKPHVHHHSRSPYRSIDIASEPLTGESWRGIPNGTVFCIDPDMRLHIEPLGLPPELVEGAVALPARAAPL